MSAGWTKMFLGDGTMGPYEGVIQLKFQNPSSKYMVSTQKCPKTRHFLFSVHWNDPTSESKDASVYRRRAQADATKHAEGLACPQKRRMLENPAEERRLKT